MKKKYVKKFLSLIIFSIIIISVIEAITNQPEEAINKDKSDILKELQKQKIDLEREKDKLEEEIPDLEKQFSQTLYKRTLDESEAIGEKLSNQRKAHREIEKEIDEIKEEEKRILYPVLCKSQRTLNEKRLIREERKRIRKLLEEGPDKALEKDPNVIEDLYNLIQKEDNPENKLYKKILPYTAKEIIYINNRIHKFGKDTIFPIAKKAAEILDQNIKEYSSINVPSIPIETPEPRDLYA